MSRTAYVVQKGATLRREGELLHVYVGRKREAELPTSELRQLVLMGNVMLTPGAVDLVLEKKIDTVFLSWHGRYRGRLVGLGSSAVTLRVAQYEALRDPARALQIARAIVRSKIRNQRAFLLRQAREGRDGEALGRACTAMRLTLVRLEGAVTLDEARGCEGAAAAAYFRVFGKLLVPDGFHFDGRNRRPPMDPVNALLSLGYTLLANAVEAAVHVVGLDPYLGALHAVEAGRPSLVCDLQEEFRAPVVDALVVAAINRGVVEPGDFEDAGPGEPVLMKPEAVRAFVQVFERRMARPVLVPGLGKRLGYRGIVEHQARKLARALLEGGGYEPFEPK
ncbi:MAG TPA: CRISPR-associated endonuclease Cas1 [Polyangiaceae bacterium]|nr:CRISPR-associated endonuclease Cas1 [Polyangiaceae bacterium]